MVFPGDQTITILRWGKRAQVFAPYNETVRLALVRYGRCGDDGCWEMSWQDVPACKAELEAKGWPVTIGAGPDTTVEQDKRDVEIDALLAEAVATVNRNGASAGMDVKPYQIAGAKWLLESGNKMLSDECGCGKTIQSIMAAYVLVKQGAKRILVIAPAYLIGYHWKEELELAGFTDVEVVAGTKEKKRSKVLSPALFHLIGWESYHRDHYFRMLGALPWDLVILDETYKMKNRNAARTKAAFDLEAKKIIELSGMPADKSPADLWPQLKRLDRNAFGGYNEWLNAECKIVDIPVHHLTAEQVAKLKVSKPWVYANRIRVDRDRVTGKPRYRMLVRTIRPGAANPMSLRRKLEPYVLRRKLREVRPDLPGEEDAKPLHIDMHPKQATIYNKLMSEILSRKAANLSISGYSVRLMQVLTTTACLRPDTHYSAKHDAALELVEKWLLSEYNVVVWTHWRESIITLLAALRKLTKRMNTECGDAHAYRVSELWGDVPVSQRGGIVDAWKSKPGSVMVCQPTSTAHGENFVACVPAMDLWLEKHAGSEPYNQGRRRFLRASSVHPVKHWHLVHKGTYDEDVEQMTLQAAAMDRTIDTAQLNKLLEKRVAAMMAAKGGA